MGADGLWPIVIPVAISALALLVSGFLVRQYAGPASSEYRTSLEGRLKLLETERNECKAELDRLRVRVESLTAEIHTLNSEMVTLYRGRGQAGVD